MASLSGNSSINQSVVKPYVEGFDAYNFSDSKLEQGVQKGIVNTKIWINTKVIQFYQKGVVNNQECWEGAGQYNRWFYVAISGYNRVGAKNKHFGVGAKNEHFGVGQGVSRPFWQLRWAFGPNYGIFGSMWVEKWNDSTDMFGPCSLHSYNQLPVMRKY